MKHFSAKYIITNSGPPLKRGIVSVNDDGTIEKVEDTGGSFIEKGSVEFHNGIIIPGFVNCHCHLELSHMKDLIPPGTGLAEFLNIFGTGRKAGTEKIAGSAFIADSAMYEEGISLCADICNNDLTFEIKKKSRIKYISLLEVFGIDPGKAHRRINEIKELAIKAESAGIDYSIVPHSAYSISLPLFGLLLPLTSSNKITSIHFMESLAEKSLLDNHSGALMETYIKSELITGEPDTVENHAAAILERITSGGNLILVHNTYADRSTISRVKKRNNLFWCLCPNANLFIENHLPPLKILIEENCQIVIGTDSLASNRSLSILEEIKTLQKYFPSISLADLLRWATLNGAKALNRENQFGSIKAGKCPGLLLLQNVDLENMKLLPESGVKRLV